MRRIIWVIVSICAICGGIARAENARELLDMAFGSNSVARVASQPEGFRQTRDRIVALGDATLPELRVIQGDPKSAWQQRVMAGICIERIERGAEIHSQGWQDDPELKNDPTAMNRDGPQSIFRVAERYWLKAGLTNHLVQLAWKGEGEHPPYGHSWDIWAAKTLEKIHHPDLVNIARERVQAIQNPLCIEGHWYYVCLLRLKDYDSLPLLFDLWIKYRDTEWNRTFRLTQEYKNTIEQSKQDADNHVDRWLSMLLLLAKPNDMNWITRKLNNINLGVDGRRYLVEYQQRCQSKTESTVLK